MKRILLISSIVLLFVGGCTKDTEFEQETTYIVTEGKVEKDIDTINGHCYVNLGLPSGLKWAACNVGASLPGDDGDYFAWGETKPKDSYTADNCLTYNKLMEDISGSEQYDAATANWGTPWRMPTKDEFQELLDECEIELGTYDGVVCYKFTGPNGNEIYLPAAGYYKNSELHYKDNNRFVMIWTSTPSGISRKEAYRLSFYCASDFSNITSDVRSRYFGFSIRAVTE